MPEPLVKFQEMDDGLTDQLPLPPETPTLKVTGMLSEPPVESETTTEAL